MTATLTAAQRTLLEGRDADCDEALHRAYFDPTDDEESGRRHLKPMAPKDVENLRRRQDGLRSKR